MLVAEVVSAQDIVSTTVKTIVAAISQLRLLRHYDLKVDAVQALVMPSQDIRSGVIVITIEWKNLKFFHYYKRYLDVDAANTAIAEVCRFQCTVMKRLLNYSQQPQELVPEVDFDVVAPLSKVDLALFGANAEQVGSQASLLVKAVIDGQLSYCKLPMSASDREGIRNASDIDGRNPPFLKSNRKEFGPHNFFVTRAVSSGYLSLNKRVRSGGYARQLIQMVAVALDRLHHECSLAHLDVRWPNIVFEWNAESKAMEAKFIDMDR